MRLSILLLMFLATHVGAQGWRLPHPIVQTLPLIPIKVEVPSLPVRPPLLAIPLLQKNDGYRYFAEPPSPPGFSSPGRGVKR